MMDENVKETVDVMTGEMPKESESIQETVLGQNAEEIQPQLPRQEVWRHDENSPFSPLYVPDRKQKNNNKITIAIVIALLVCLVAGMIFAVSRLVEAAVGEASAGFAVWNENVDEWKSQLEDYLESEQEAETPIPEEDIFDYDFTFDYPQDFDFEENYDVYVPSPEDEYYVEVTDSIRDDLYYGVEKQDYSFNDENAAVNVYVEYIVAEGLDFDDKINEALESNAMYYAKEFAENDATNLEVYVRSYVTYMDEELLSVVINEQYVWEGEMQVDLYCMNFDLKTGSLLYNTSIIEPSEELAGAFRDMSNYQNGESTVINELSDEDIATYFSEEDSLILFYTPVGLEVGFNHYNGWITATIKDYEKYLSKL